jgi:hypothetical protein
MEEELDQSIKRKDKGTRLQRTETGRGTKQEQNRNWISNKVHYKTGLQ